MSNPLIDLKKSMIDNFLGPDKVNLKEGEKQCPNCKRRYVPDCSPNLGTSTQREQHISGICSDECWNQFLGPE